MFKFIKRIMGLSGEYRKKLNRAYVLSFFESLAVCAYDHNKR